MPTWSFLLRGEQQRSSTGGCPPSRLPAGRTLLRGCFAPILKIRKASAVQLAPPWSRGHRLCSGQACREAGWQSGPCLCPRAAVDCKPLFHYASALFSLHGLDLGTRHVPVTGWGLLALKILQSAHHNMHLLWQLVYPSAKMLKMIHQLPSLCQDPTGSSHPSPKARAAS